jgi:hypothetical protein
MRRCIRTICRRGLWLVAFIGLLYLGCYLHLRLHHDLIHVRHFAGSQVQHSIRAGMPDGPSVFVAMLSTNRLDDAVAIETALGWRQFWIEAIFAPPRLAEEAIWMSNP